MKKLVKLVTTSFLNTKFKEAETKFVTMLNILLLKNVKSLLQKILLQD